MRRVFCVYASLALILLALTISASNASTIQIGLQIDKQVYNVNETVHITGNLTEDGVIVDNSTVAIQINNPAGNPVILRTLNTGINTTDILAKVVILDLRTMDSMGNNKTLFNKGTTAYISIIVENVDYLDHLVKGAFYIQYSDNSPFIAFFPFTVNVTAQHGFQYITSLPIPYGAVPGETIIYASIYSDYPSLGGLAYCKEKRASFYIQSTVPLAAPQPLVFDMSFKTPKYDAKLGNYTVYARGYYRFQLTTNIKGFKVVLLGDLYKDGKIDMRDIGAICGLYGTRQGDPAWNPEADLDGSGRVDMRDIGIQCTNFGATGTY
jgi:hypothetical protein